jgi:hypothetical protein
VERPKIQETEILAQSRGSRSGAIAIASHSVPQLKKVLDVQFRLPAENNSSEGQVSNSSYYTDPPLHPQSRAVNASKRTAPPRLAVASPAGLKNLYVPVALQFFHPGTAPRFARRRHLGSAGNGHTRQYKFRITASQCESENTHQRRRWRIPYGILQWV